VQTFSKLSAPAGIGGCRRWPVGLDSPVVWEQRFRGNLEGFGRMSKLRRAATRNQILVSSVIALLIVVGSALFMLRNGDPLLPAGESSWVYFRCADCGTVFHLDGREMNAAHERGDLATARCGRGRGVVCKSCGSRNTVRIEKPPAPGLAGGD